MTYGAKKSEPYITSTVAAELLSTTVEDALMELPVVSADIRW